MQFDIYDFYPRPHFHIFQFSMWIFYVCKKRVTLKQSSMGTDTKIWFLNRNFRFKNRISVELFSQFLTACFSFHFDALSIFQYVVTILHSILP